MNQEEFKEWIELNISAICSSIATLGKTAKENNAAIAALQEEVRVLQMKIGERTRATNDRVKALEADAEDFNKELIVLTTAFDELRDKVNGAESAESDEWQVVFRLGKPKPPHRRLINEKGEFRDTTGATCVFRRPRQLPGVGELYIGSYGGGITLDYALIEELIPALQQFLDTGAFPWESPNSQEAR